MNIEIRHIEPQDWAEISKIYRQGQQTGIATFETEVPTWEQWNSSHLPTCRLAALLNNDLIGWSALSSVSDRHVYRGVAEVSVYVDAVHSGKGIGQKLMVRLIDESEKEGIWTLQSGIFRENEASIYLHRKVGFREIGYREKVGQRKGVWYDNIIMERRSKKTGIN